MQRTGVRQANPVELSEANRHDLQKARDMLRTVETLRPDWYERPKLLTEIDLLEGKPDEAIIDLREVLRLGPPDPLQVRRLAQLLLMQKRYSEVKEVLDTYGKANKGLERIEAVNDQLNGRPDLALQRLEQLIPKDSDQSPAITCITDNCWPRPEKTSKPKRNSAGRSNWHRNNRKRGWLLFNFLMSQRSRRRGSQNRSRIANSIARRSSEYGHCPRL